MTKHPGIGILSPQGNHGYRLKYRDPEDDKIKRPTLPARMQGDTVKARKQREDHAIRKSIWLQRAALKAEDEPETNLVPLKLRDGVQSFYDSRGSDRTVETYGEGCERFLRYLEKQKPPVRTTDKIRIRHLTGFNTTVGKVKGRTATTRNKWRRSTKTMLRFWVGMDATRLSSDKIRDALKAEVAPTDPVECLKERQIQQSLRAAIAHDQDTYSMTRREKAGKVGKGGTLRYDPIAPFTLFMFLSGLRRGAALRLRWEDVDLEWADRTGVVGRLHVRSASSKTKQGRPVTLSVSPLLRKLLVAQKVRTGGHPTARVFPDLTEDGAIKAKLRLRKAHGAPAAFSWQECRRVCTTYLVNSAIFPSPILQTARHMGHSPDVLERYYAGQRPDLDENARTLGELYGIRKLGNQIVSSIASPSDHDASVSRIAASK